MGAAPSSPACASGASECLGMPMLMGGRHFSTVVGMWAWNRHENRSEPESVFLPAAVWGKGGSDVGFGFFFFKSEN